MKGHSHETTPIPDTETSATGPDGQNQHSIQSASIVNTDHSHRQITMTTLDDIAALLRQQNELLQRFVSTTVNMPVAEPVRSDKARRDEEARLRFSAPKKARKQ